MTALVRRAMASDTEAFLELMDRNSLAMYKVARAILRNDEDVADAIQDTILTCFEKMNTLQKPEYFKTWMIRILINKCYAILDYYRKLNHMDNLPETAREDASMAEFEFKQMLAAVDEKYRIVLVLYYVEGFRTDEIAELLELNKNTVKTRLKRAREQLRGVYADTAAKHVSPDEVGMEQAGADARRTVRTDEKWFKRGSSVCRGRECERLPMKEAALFQTDRRAF